MCFHFLEGLHHAYYDVEEVDPEVFATIKAQKGDGQKIPPPPDQATTYATARQLNDPLYREELKMQGIHVCGRVTKQGLNAMDNERRSYDRFYSNQARLRARLIARQKQKENEAATKAR